MGKPRLKITAADLWRDREICLNWLKDRPGRSLTDEDLELYSKIIRAVSDTLGNSGESRGHPQTAH